MQVCQRFHFMAFYINVRPKSERFGLFSPVCERAMPDLAHAWHAAVCFIAMHLAYTCLPGVCEYSDNSIDHFRTFFQGSCQHENLRGVGGLR